jgi:hypothetical protein
VKCYTVSKTAKNTPMTNQVLQNPEAQSREPISIVQRAFRFGLVIALLHRLLLQLWMGLVWFIVGELMLNLPEVQRNAEDAPPVMESAAERTLLQIWLRWDATNYLKIAETGYTKALSVFCPLYPALINYVNLVLPGGAEVAGLVVSSLCLFLACAFFYLIVIHYYNDEILARYTVLMWVIFPSAFFLSSIYTESLFLALTLGGYWLQLKRQWVWAGILGALAVLTRIQGLILLAPFGWIILEYAWAERQTYLQRLWFVIPRAAPLLLLPLVALGFVAWRNSEGFPSMDDVYMNYGVHAEMTNPIEGYLIEIQSLSKSPNLVFFIDFAGYVVSFTLLTVMVIVPRYRIIPLLLYGWSFWLSIGTGVNYYPDTAPTIQSGLRYVLMIFPMYIVLGDIMLRGNKASRLTLVTALAFGLMALSAATALAIGPA